MVSGAISHTGYYHVDPDQYDVTAIHHPVVHNKIWRGNWDNYSKIKDKPLVMHRRHDLLCSACP